ncbi:MAG TPA: hypothetical protein VI322_04325 [Candidatus Saccharimonadia bacterium]
MTSSSQGWLCLSCGHVEPTAGRQANAPAKPAPPAPAEPQSAPAGTPEPVLADTSGSGTAVTPPAAAEAPAVLASGFIDPRTPVATSMATARRLTFDRRQRRRVLLFWLVMALLIGGITAAGYLWVFEPRVALAGYLQRLVTARTATFASSATVAATGGTKITVTSTGQVDVRDQNHPKLDATVKAELGLSAGVALPGSSPTSGAIATQIKVIDQTFYFKLMQFTLSELIPVKLSDDWYMYKLEAAAGTCAKATGSSGSFLGTSMLTKIPVTHASFKGVDTIKGTPMLHFVGTMDNSKLQAAIDKANKHLSAECKLTVSADDYKNVSVTYELWRGWSADRLRVSIADSTSKTTADITLDSSGYSRPVTITAPSDTKDFTKVLQDLFSADATGTPPTTRHNVPPDTATTAQKARDTQRKADIDQLNGALANYFNNHQAYPVTLKGLTVRTENVPAVLAKLPADPTNKAPYTYVYAPVPDKTGAYRSYTLTSCLENGADVGLHVVDPVAPCKTATYQLQSSGE